MAQNSKAEALSEEIFVKKEQILSYFSKPPSKATFYRWVQSGKIVRSSLSDEYYHLNATLKNCGLPLEDIAKFNKDPSKKTRVEEVSKLVWLVFHAFCSLCPKQKPYVPILPEPSTYTMQDEVLYEKIKSHMEFSIRPNDKNVMDYAYLYLTGVEHLAYLLIPDSEFPETPKLKSLSRGEIVGPLPTSHPKPE